MAALLIAAALFAAVPAGNVAAGPGDCVSQEDGDWNAGATWLGCSGPGGIPAVTDIVTVAHSVAITADQAVDSLTIGASGVVYFTTPATLTISSVFEVDGGIFSPEILDENGDPTNSGGLVSFAPGAQQILTNGAWVDFWNLTKAASGTGQSLSFDPAIDGVGGVHIVNNVTLTGTAVDDLVLQSTVPDTQWQIWPDDVYIIQNVNVQDSKNVSPTVEIIMVADSVDSGNNVGWVFGTPEITLASDLNPAPDDVSVTFTATTSPAGVGGNVTFFNDGVEIPGCIDLPVESNTATCAINELDEGTYPITAVYSSFGPFAPVTSNTVSQVVGTLVTVTLNSMVNPAAVGEILTIQATLSPLTTVGTVEFRNGGDPIPECAAVAISAGKAVCTVTMAAGTHEISAEYVEGDAHSTTLNQVVKNLSTVTLASSHPSASFGQQITLTAAVTAPANATGTVTFKKGNNNIPGCVNVALVSAAATCDVSGLMPGSYNFSVVYSGNETTFGFEPPAIVQNVDLIYFYMPLIQR